jgi:hypothetical protein
MVALKLRIDPGTEIRGRVDHFVFFLCFLDLAYRAYIVEQDALRELSKYKLVVLIDAHRPVAMFGYQDGPSSDLLTLVRCDHYYNSMAVSMSYVSTPLLLVLLLLVLVLVLVLVLLFLLLLCAPPGGHVRVSGWAQQ